MKKAMILVVVLALALGGCSGMSSTEQRVLSGGAIGASGGALIGWAAGSPAAERPSAAAPGSWAVISTISTRNPGAADQGRCLRSQTCPACGAAIGGGAGLLGGYAYDRYEKSQGRP